MSNPKVKLLPFADISNYVEGFDIVSTQWGGDGRVYVLLMNQIPERKRGVFVQSKLNQSYTYKVLIVTDQNIEEVVIWGQTFNYHYVQPLHEHLLLIGARCTNYGNGQVDLNAKVCDLDGNTIREFLLGDGIQSVQVTEKGTIWTSYFDEGVFGNYGWSDPIGSYGLLAWDEHGNKLYENREADIADCYALNVVNEKQVWFYFYTDFELGCISGGTREPNVTFMNPNISGSSGFSTDGYHFLFDAGYGKHGTFVLKKMEKPGRLSKGQKVDLLNENGQPFKQARQDFRQHRLLLSEGNLLYRVTIEEITSASGLD
ncbi:MULTISPECIES: hypothetical protein [unclassified Paenibacillus]|uniref:hypothetical protein n=1 Tax=unclassified Paenibacillus TaxID=185978 RepID=UPI000CFD0CE5|nr:MULTISPECIES: hypothetical protein [unclassified Paenibacillus]PRA08702.1 hypothetical protein CQ043_01595 [Paenibacillus sp. MYb63]PRA48636.1 hypothetical protein CQ061_10050 [Paenibacillus sp. MYb67]QZN78545.1 hypothetical protein K5K90_15980 [Paenibacillus sp. DR312]